MPEKDIKIPHRSATNYLTHSATGALLAGPSPDGMFHLTFFADRVHVKTETGCFVEPGTYTVGLREDDIESFRENKVSISVSPATLRDLSRILARRVADWDKEVGGE
jgi:hypothetical protein